MKTKKKCRGRVEFGEDYIRISEKGEEIVYWTQQEWEEDATVVYSIGNAIKLASECKMDKLKRLVGK